LIFKRYITHKESKTSFKQGIHYSLLTADFVSEIVKELSDLSDLSVLGILNSMYD